MFTVVDRCGRDCCSEMVRSSCSARSDDMKQRCRLMCGLCKSRAVWSAVSFGDAEFFRILGNIYVPMPYVRCTCGFNCFCFMGANVLRGFS